MRRTDSRSDTLAYVKALQNYRSKLLEHQKRCLEVLKDYPPEKMKLPCLQMLLDSMDIPYRKGNREDLLMRLELVQSKKIKVPPRRTRTALEFSECRNQLDPSLGLVGIPHDIVRHIFAYLEIDDLEKCSSVCKYLYSDARSILDSIGKVRNIFFAPLLF